ncbi:two-component system sensor kinase [Citrobacter koseri]|uniref:Two-component system sensor kinase n=1 Tax=Citrobacter koseri TaxID=545 RepID=A0A2X2WV15_CITKO|nr:two-component system sensor kinase [Citrobacter koseri]
MRWAKPQSLYLQLLLFLGLPLVLLWGLSAFNSYVSALQAATQAYDRTLLSSARTVAERLVVRHDKLEVNVPWVVLDSFELNMNDRLYYKVVDPGGKVISGYDDLPRDAAFHLANPALPGVGVVLSHPVSRTGYPRGASAPAGK